MATFTDKPATAVILSLTSLLKRKEQHFNAVLKSAIFSLSAVALSIGSATSATHADGGYFNIASDADQADAWICRLESAHGRGWFMRCQTLAEVLADDPVLPTDATLSPDMMIPLHGVPYADSDLVQLASAVLCGTQSDCQVVVASR